MSTDSQFIGWVAHDKTAAQGKLVLEPYKVKPFEDDDAELRIIACGCCASDIHTLRSGWGESKYPTVVGHEICGIVERVGKNVKNVKVGERVGVGAQSGSCLECAQCKDNRESYCDSHLGTYQGVYKDGSHSMGGYAKRWRGPAHFCVHIPDTLPSHVAGPLMCGGVTAYSPLKDGGVGGPDGKTVGIIGIGGIGAFGIAFARALGATTVVAISTTASKKDLAMQLGATDLFAFKEDKEGWKRWRRKFDVILNTSAVADMPYDKFLFLLRPRGTLWNIAVPEQPCQPIPIGALLFSGARLGGSVVGGPAQIREMLELAAKTNLPVMIEKRPFSEANQMIVDMEAGKPRFRYSLIVDENAKI